MFEVEASDGGHVVWCGDVEVAVFATRREAEAHISVLVAEAEHMEALIDEALEGAERSAERYAVWERTQEAEDEAVAYLVERGVI